MQANQNTNVYFTGIINLNGYPCKLEFGDLYTAEIEYYRAPLNADKIFRKFILVEHKSMTPKYRQKYSEQVATITDVWQTIDADGNIEDNPQGIVLPSNDELQSPTLKHRLDDNTGTLIDMGNGDQWIGHWSLFKMLSETSGIRLPEHIFNGYFIKLSRMTSILGKDNPIYIDRSHQIEYPLIEPFNASYGLKQPLVVKGSCTDNTAQATEETPEPTPNGSFTIEVVNSEGDAQVSLDAQTWVNANSSYSLTQLAAGDYLVYVKDSNEEIITFKFVINDATA